MLTWSESNIKNIDDLWAKSATENANAETILSHSKKVFEKAVARVKYKEKVLRSVFGDDGFEEFYEMVKVCALFHDFGKCTIGFQELVHANRRGNNVHHAAISWIPVYCSTLMSKWELERALTTPLIIAHHHRGFSTNPFEDLNGKRIEFPDKKILAGLSFELLKELSCQKEIDKKALAERISKITNKLKDGEQVRKKWKEKLHNTIREFIRNGKLEPKKIRTLYSIGLGILQASDWEASRGDSLCQLVDCGSEQIINGMKARAEIQGRHFDRLYWHQEKAQSCDGHLLIRAPTGRGKFESALLWHSRQKEVQMAYLLPAMVLSNKLYDRAVNYFEPKNGISSSIALLHSTAKYRIHTLDEECHSNTDIRALISRHRAFGAQLTFGTVDQALLSVLNAGYWEQTMMNLAGSDVVLDEIHCYHPTTLGLILKFIEDLSSIGTRFCFMSATMPKPLITFLEESLQKGKLEKVFCKRDDEPKKRIKIHMEEKTLVECVPQIIDDFRGNKKVLVVTNTVKNARDIYEEVCKEIKIEERNNVCLLHSLFTVNDREEKEKELETKCEEKGKILISTQVIEVGIDIDYNVLYTEEAPPDALIQRFGRINRHGKRDVEDVHIVPLSPGGNRIYLDAREMVEIAKDMFLDLDGSVPSEEDFIEIVEKACGEIMEKKEYHDRIEEWKSKVDEIRKEKLYIGEYDICRESDLQIRPSEQPRIAVIPEIEWKCKWNYVSQLSQAQKKDSWKIFGSTIKIPVYWLKKLRVIKDDFEGYPVVRMEYRKELGATEKEVKEEEDNII